MTLLGLQIGQLLAIFGAAGGVLAVLYLLRQHRRRLEVPFARLWQRVLRQSEATSLWQKLKRWLSLLLQLLILGLLVLALGDPRLGPSHKGRTLALLVDASASMQARVPGPAGRERTRLDVAKDEARRLVRDLAGDDLAVVVALDGQPAPLGGLSQDERELLQQVDAVAPRDEPADLPRALRLAGDLLSGRKNPQVVLISDGGFDDATLEALAGELQSKAHPTRSPSASGLPASGEAFSGLDLRYVPVPRQVDPEAGNVAITAFSVRRYRHNRLSYEVLLELTSFPPPGARAAVPVRLELLQEGETVDVQDLTLQPGERVQRIYPNLGGSGAHLEARVRLQGAAPGDILPLDDRAYAVLPQRHKQRLLLVTRGDLFLEGALLSTGAGEESQIEIQKVAPAGYDAKKAGRYDVVLFDDFTPAEAPDTSTLYLNPQGTGSPLPIAETLTVPLLTDVAGGHPLMRWVTLKDLNVSRASVFKIGHGDVALASMLRKPIVVAREGRSGGALRRSLLVGFDLRHSDLPLRVAFPVLLVNALDWFAGETEAAPQEYATGHTWRIPVGTSGPVTLALPDGTRAPLPVYEGYALYHGQRAGFYEVERPGEAPLLLAGNLSDATESAARVRPELRIGPAPGKVLPPPEAGRSAIRRVIWPYLLALALALLLIEWWTYQRRWTV